MADRSVVARLGANVTGYVNNIRVAKSATVDFSKSAIAYGQKHQAQLDELANKAAILGTGMLALAGFAVKSAMDWETAWAGVTKTINGTPEQLARIEQGLQDMSAVKPTTAVELAAIAESAGALGVETDSILSFTSVMADLGETTNLTSEEAATSIAQLMNVMQTAPDDVDNLGSALVDLGNKGASTERQIIQMAQNIAGAGSIVGLSEANVLALGNALASSGIEAEAGGSAISNVLIDIEKATATGSDKLTQFAQVAGMSADEFAAKWQADPADALADFVEGLGAMNDRGEDVFSTLSALGQSDIRVTRALLNMAASGDMLRESLANGDAAWEKNSALAIEAAKRYDTTASQMKMSWNEVKAAAVDAGNGLLPAVRAIADAVGGLADAFGSLPDEVQGGITAIGAVGGAGLLAMAGLVKLTTSLASTRTAMSVLQTTAPASALAVGRLSKAVGAATVALGVYYALNKSQGGGDKVAGTEAITKQFLAISNGSEKAKKALNDLAKLKGDADLLTRSNPFTDGSSSADIGGIKDLFDKASRNGLQGLGNKLTPYDDAYDTAQKGIKQIDAALTQMVASGAVEQAAAGFKFLGEESGKTVKELNEQLPGYAEAVQGVANQQEIAAKSTDDLSGAMAGVPGMTDEAAKALDEARDKAREAGGAFIDLGDDLDNPKVSLEAWIKQLEDQGKALRDFTKNAKTAAKEGLDEGLIASLQEAGPAGALRMSELADASDAEINRANKAWRRGQRAIEDYVDLVVPAKNVDVNIEDGVAELRRLQNLIDGMNGKTVRVAVTGGIGGGITKNAEGGAIVGPGTGTSDSILSLVSNGEHVLTAAEVAKMGGQAAVYRFRQQLNSGNIMAYATGGAVGASPLELMQQQKQVRDLERSLKEQETVGKGKSKRKRLALRGLDRQIAQLELAEARQELADLMSGKAARDEAAEKAQDARDVRRDSANGTRDSVASGLAGGFGLKNFTGKNAYGFYGAVSGSSIASGAQAFAAKVKAFAAKYEAARKMGIPIAMLEEIAGLGIEEGTQGLDALLSASSADIASIQQSYRDIDTYAKGAGEVLAKALDLTAAGQDSAIGYAAGFIEGLNGQAAAIQAAIGNAASGKTSKVPATVKKAVAYLKRAGGGPIVGPGTGTSDDVLMYGSNGEHVFTAADVDAMGGQSAVSRFRASLHQPVTQTFTAEAFGAGYAASGNSSGRVALSQEDRQMMTSFISAVDELASRPIQAQLQVSGRQAGTLVQVGQTTLERQG